MQRGSRCYRRQLGPQCLRQPEAVAGDARSDWREGRHKRHAALGAPLPSSPGGQPIEDHSRPLDDVSPRLSVPDDGDGGRIDQDEVDEVLLSRRRGSQHEAQYLASPDVARLQARVDEVLARMP